MKTAMLDYILFPAKLVPLLASVDWQKSLVQVVSNSKEIHVTDAGFRDAGDCGGITGGDP